MTWRWATGGKRVSGAARLCPVALPSSPPLDPATEKAEHAARIAAMLDRWAAEDTTGEPDWDVETFERLDLTRSLASSEPTGTPKP